jgi:hypothetical protein
MTAAEELAALTGAKLTMPTRTLLQGKPVHNYFTETNIRSTHAELLEGHRERVASRLKAVPANEDHAGPRKLARSL